MKPTNAFAVQVFRMSNEPRYSAIDILRANGLHKRKIRL